jgi:hypothetical protein
MMARVDLDMMEYVEKEEAARAGSRGEMSDIWHRSSEAPQQTTTREAKRSGRESPANQKGGKSGVLPAAETTSDGHLGSTLGRICTRPIT